MTNNDFDIMVEDAIRASIERSTEAEKEKDAAEMVTASAKLYAAYNEDLQGRYKADLDYKSLEVEKEKLEIEKEIKMAEIQSENVKSRKAVFLQVASMLTTAGMAALCFKHEADGHLMPDRVVNFARSFGRTK